MGKAEVDQHIQGYKELNRFKIFELLEYYFTKILLNEKNSVIKKTLPKRCIIRVRNKNDVGVLNKGSLIENLVFVPNK